MCSFILSSKNLEGLGAAYSHGRLTHEKIRAQPGHVVHEVIESG